MLEITVSAMQAIRGVLAAVTPTSETSLRISSTAHDGIGWQLAIGQPADPHDRVVRRGDVAILVASNAVAALDDKVLDARLEGGRVQFSVEPARSGMAPAKDAALAGADRRR
jgi:iron-sulfur cluster assembly protein